MTNTNLNVILANGAIFVMHYDDEGVQFDLYAPDDTAPRSPIPAPGVDPAYTRTITYEEIAEDMKAAFEAPPAVPPVDERPVCVTVGWLAEHPTFAARLEYLDHNGEPEWHPASTAVATIDPGWPVEVREVQR